MINHKQYSSATDKESMVVSYLPLVRRIAGRLYIPNPEVVDRDDLVSHGVIGLMEAIDKYDPSRQISFESYAYQRIRGAMIDSIRALSFTPRSVNERIKSYRAVEDKLLALGAEITEERMAEELSLTVEQVRETVGHIALRSVVSLDRILFSDEGDEVAVSQVIVSEASPDPEQILEKAEFQSLLTLAIEQLPQRDREMLNMYYVEEFTLKEIAAVFGVTEGRVSQLHSRAIARLRQALGYARKDGAR